MEAERTLLALLGIEYTYGRSLLRGMLEESRLRPGSRVRLVRSEAELRQVLEGKERFAAAIGMIWDESLVSRLKAVTGLTISFANRVPYPADRYVCLDDRAIGSMGAQAFIDLGIRRLGVFQTEAHFHLKERTVGFMQRSAEAGLSRPVLLKAPGEAVAWIQKGREPLGILAGNDVLGRELVERCEASSIRIPDQLSVIGVDDDDVYVHLGRRSLSSIQLPFEEMGRLAVRMGLGDGGVPADELVDFVPTRVIHRQTTGVEAGLPANLRKFIGYIRWERPLPPSVSAACDRLNLERRSLEMSCRERLQTSPGALLKNERRMLAEGMRSEGAEPDEIAEALGYVQVRSLKRLLSG